jgi:ABC-type Zn uptake system ZnuABC Zn-binding protein ZnuA
VAILASILALALAAPACSSPSSAGSSGGAVGAGGPSLRIVTGLYPLAQAAQQIGQGKVAVTDLVPPGTDPVTFRPSASDVAQIRSAGLVLTTGTGVEPWLTSADAGGSNLVDLAAKLGTTDAYLWLDPQLMRAAVTAIANAMQSADPAAAHVYQQGDRDYGVLVSSTAIDYENTLSACPERAIVTADGAFAGMAKRYGLKDLVLGTPAPGASQATVSTGVDAVRTTGASSVFSEPWISPAAQATVAAVAAVAQVKQRSLDTLLAPPPAGWPRHTTYLSLMESNLGTLTSALGCPNSITGS